MIENFAELPGVQSHQTRCKNPLRSKWTEASRQAPRGSQNITARTTETRRWPGPLFYKPRIICAWPGLCGIKIGWPAPQMAAWWDLWHVHVCAELRRECKEQWARLGCRCCSAWGSWLHHCCLTLKATESTFSRVLAMKPHQKQEGNPPPPLMSLQGSHRPSLTSHWLAKKKYLNGTAPFSQRRQKEWIWSWEAIKW